MCGLPGGRKNCLDCQVQRVVDSPMGSWLIGVDDGDNTAFASDVLANNLDHEAEGICCKCTDDIKLGTSAVHAGRLVSYSEGA